MYKSMYHFTYFLTYFLTLCSRVLFEKLTGFQLVKKFLTFYGIRKFITVCTKARHLSLYWASSIQSISPHPTSRRSILILSSHPFKWPFPSGFPTKALYTPLFALLRATCLAYLIQEFITQIILGEEYRSLSSSLCSFLHSPVTSPLIDPNILLKHLEPTFLPQCERSSFTPIQNNRQNYSFVYFLIFKNLDS
jgi:hypothetical protein